MKPNKLPVATTISLVLCAIWTIQGFTKLKGTADGWILAGILITLIVVSLAHHYRNAPPRKHMTWTSLVLLVLAGLVRFGEFQ